MPPLGLDPQAQGKVTGATLISYRRAAHMLTSWLLQHGLHPTSATEWDDLIVEWKVHGKPSKTQFTTALAAVEFFFPLYRGKLRWSHAVRSGWEVAHTPQHTVPMLSGLVRLYSIHISAYGSPRMGIGMVLQQKKGFRPSELLGLRAKDLVLPREMGSADLPSMIIGLGIRQGTKAKRPQSAVLPCSEDKALTEALENLKELTEAEDRLFPYSLEQYNRCIRKVSNDLNLDIKFTPHSMRAGFASEGRALGKSFTELKEEGRWISDASLRVYIDLVSAAAIAQSPAVRALSNDVAQASVVWPQYFTRAWLGECDATQGGQATSSRSRIARGRSPGGAGAGLLAGRA